MYMQQLNIVELIETNPITNLSKDYNVKLLTKIKNNFTEFEQHLFLSSFYCYLKYHPVNDFVIDLDDVWKWLGFSVKIKAKTLLEKHFKENIDYKKSLCDSVEQTKHVKGGHNKETFLLNIKTFKLFCIKSETKKADEIHNYYMKMEEIIQDTIQEETCELKKQLEKTNQIIDIQSHQLENVEKDKELLKEKTLLEQFPLNTQCIYIGKVNNKTLGNPNSKMYQETVIKFGQSNNLIERVKCHKNTYDNFILYAAFKVKNKIEIENCIKKNVLLQKRIRSITINDIAHRELLALDNENFTIEKMCDYFKDIIKENEYNVENYNLLLHKNEHLEEEVIQLKNIIQEKDLKITNLMKYKPDITVETQNKIAGDFAICNSGYVLYAFECDNMRYKCAMSRQNAFNSVEVNLKNLHENGLIKYNVSISYPFSEKIMTFLLKKTTTFLGNTMYESSFENIKKIIDITSKLEKILIDNSNDLDNLLNFIEGKEMEILEEVIDFEVPTLTVGSGFTVTITVSLLLSQVLFMVQT